MENNSPASQEQTVSSQAQEAISMIKENQAAQVKDLKIKKNSLIDTATTLEIQLTRMSWDMFKFIGIYRKNFWARIMPIIVFLLVATTEMPLNASSFEIFGRSQIETLLLALFAGAVIALMAELAGSQLKRYVVTKKSSNLVTGIVSIIMTMIGLYVVSEMRVQYLSIMNSVSMTSQIAQFLFSLFIFSAGVGASYKFTSSVKNKEQEKTYYQILKQFKRINRQVSRIEKTIDGVNKKNAKKIDRLIDGMLKSEKENNVVIPEPVDNTELEEAQRMIMEKNNLRKSDIAEEVVGEIAEVKVNEN